MRHFILSTGFAFAFVIVALIIVGSIFDQPLKP